MLFRWHFPFVFRIIFMLFLGDIFLFFFIERYLTFKRTFRFNFFLRIFIWLNSKDSIIWEPWVISTLFWFQIFTIKYKIKMFMKLFFTLNSFAVCKLFLILLVIDIIFHEFPTLNYLDLSDFYWNFKTFFLSSSQSFMSFNLN